MAQSRTLLIIVGAILALVGAAVVVVVLAGDDRQTFAPGTPEATIQAYLEAWEADDLDAAYAYFSRDAQHAMPISEFRSTSDDHRAYSGTQRRSVFIDGVDGEGDRARVRLTVEEYYGDGLTGGGSYRSERSVRLVRETGVWRIDEPLVWLDPGPFGL